MSKCFICGVTITEENTGYFRAGGGLASICKACNKIYALAATIRKLTREQQLSKVGDLDGRSRLYRLIHDNPELSKLEQVKMYLGGGGS